MTPFRRLTNRCLPMNDRAALYAAVCANPDEDTPRLALADWLEEHGDARRAVFIRAKIDGHARKEADTPAAWALRFLDGEYFDSSERIDWAATDPELGALVAADKALVRQKFALRAKTDGLPRLRGITFGGDERGFFNTVSADDGATFVRHAREIFRSAPVASVFLGSLNADDARELVAGGHLVHIRELNLDEVADPEALRVLGEHPDAAGVRTLDIEGSDENAALADALAAGKHWTGLRKLALMDLGTGDDPLTDERAGKLFRKPVFSGLRELAAWGNEFGDAAARGIAAGGLPELRFLDLAINDITGDGALALARSKGLPNLKFLDISTNDIADPAAVAALIATPKFPELVVLRMAATDLPGPDAKALSRGPSRGPTLRVLNLGTGPAAADGAAALAACPAAHGLWYLSWHLSGLTAKAVQALVASPGFDRLTYLDLEGNRLTVTAARALAEWPKAAALQWLDLASNPLTPDGLAALAASPHLTGIKYLSTGGTANTRAVKALKKRFGKAYVRQ